MSSKRHGPDRTLGSARHIGPSVRPPRIRKKRLAKNQISVYFSCFIYLEIRKNSSRTNHEQITTMASGATLLNQNSEFSADTLHVVGSWYAPTTCKVSALRTGEKSRSEKKKATFDHFVRSQAAGGAPDGQNVAQNWIFSVDTLHVVGSNRMQSIGTASARESRSEK
jgi:hypothetical protein